MTEDYNPLKGWSKEQIKAALKSTTKSELLKQAIAWQNLAMNLMQQREAQKNKAVDGSYDNTEEGTSVED
jgi:hypothetical protein|tara:strand:+ start:2051 stop:2260 length:210 start_codon:yes stop_codon:yes gene_type:complete